MKRSIFTLLFSFVLYLNISFAQVGVGIFGLPPNDAQSYSKPLATYVGTFFNSGAYYSAELPETFRFKFSIIGMYSSIPDGQKTFTPNSDLEGYTNLGTTSTFVGEKGGLYLGPQGFLTYPAGFNVSSIPSGVYQIAGSYYGTELLLRFFPNLKFSDVETGFWGIGVKHNISQWIPDLPLDIALQILYNNFDLEYVGDNPRNYINMGSKN